MRLGVINEQTYTRAHFKVNEIVQNIVSSKVETQKSSTKRLQVIEHWYRFSKMERNDIIKSYTKWLVTRRNYYDTFPVDVMI